MEIKQNQDSAIRQLANLRAKRIVKIKAKLGQKLLFWACAAKQDENNQLFFCYEKQQMYAESCLYFKK